MIAGHISLVDHLKVLTAVATFVWVRLLIVYLTRMSETCTGGTAGASRCLRRSRKKRNHGGDIKLVGGLQSSRLHRYLQRLVARMPESDRDWLIGQYPLVQHELEIARCIGSGGSTPDAISGGDHYIGDGSSFWGSASRWITAPSIWNGRAARESPAPDGHGRNRNKPMRAAAATAMIVHTTFFCHAPQLDAVVRESIIQLFDFLVARNPFAAERGSKT